MIDIEKLLQDRGIHYVVDGPNTAKGNINVQCPFCGKADKSEHMGIKLSTGWWGCWRSKEHRGANLAYLLQHLLGVSYQEAKRLAGKEERNVDPDALESLAAGSLYQQEEERSDDRTLRNILLPKSLRMFGSRDHKEKRFLRYLEGRGFDSQAAMYYRMRWAVTGDYKWRIVLPVSLYGVMVTFIGRAIGDTELRYKAQSAEEATLSVKQTLFNFDNALMGGRKLFVVEGPFDALKLDWYGREQGCRAIGLFNMNLEEEQFYLLWELAEAFKEVHVILDKGMDMEGVEILDQLAPFIPPSTTYTLPSVKDPGDLTPKQVKALCDGVL